MSRNKKQVIIIRGPSGSGKSTYVKNNYPNAVVCSADKYFVDSDGNYKFNPSLLGSAHGACKSSFKRAIKDEIPIIVVDNTNTRLREFKPYVVAAKNAGYDVKIIRLEVSTGVAAKRNIHNVPIAIVRKQAGRMADTPPEWNEEIVFNE